ncbi:MAG: hypothetical protein EA349_11630 [Halomonadaceae bacterium]|nr:MAG: hypothetical protein EA349_11630 [Halomonadaceae bacterium]
MKKDSDTVSVTRRLRQTLTRLGGRLAPRLQSRLDERLDRITDTLDGWNQRLAQGALPTDRRHRVDALNRQGVRRKLRVVSISDKSGKNI